MSGAGPEGGAGAPRPTARFEIDGRPWRVYDAWRIPGGAGLAYFLPLDADTGDRRALLEPGVTLEGLGPEGLASLWAEAARLTATERRVIDEAGDVWLVQSVGPVWAESGSAADALGLRARCISSERAGLAIDGTTPAMLSDEELLARLPAGRDDRG